MNDFVDNLIDNAATLSASGNSAKFMRPKADTARRVSFLVALGAAPTGTSPTLKYTLQASIDGTTWYDVAATGTLNTSGQTARLEAYALEPFWRVAKAIGGTGSPTFTLVTSHLVFSRVPRNA